MPFSIKIRENSADINSPWLFEKNFNTLDELQAVRKHCSNKREMGFFESLVIPVRTDEHFCEDFFLPTFNNHALKIHNFALKILMTPTCLILDISTLLVRLITVIPWHYLHSSRQENLLHRYLTNERADARLLNTDCVRLRLEWEQERHRYLANVEEEAGLLNTIRPRFESEEEQAGAMDNENMTVIREETFRFIYLPENASPTTPIYSTRGIP